MDHGALEELWLDFTEGTLPEVEARALRAHLAACSVCAARYERLAAAHQASVVAGRVVREEEGSTPIAGAVRDRILAATRMAAARPVPPRRVWMLPGLAALAVAAATILVLHVEATRRGDARFLRETLALVAPPVGVRGTEDALSAAAQMATERWRRGELRVRASATECPGGGVRVAGLVDAGGEPILLAVRERDRTDVYAFREDGLQVGSTRIVGGSRSEFLLPPRTRAEARALLDKPRCPPATW